MLSSKLQWDLHLSSSSCFKTSPIIWPTLCSALMLSSVVSKSFCSPFMSIRRVFSFASISLSSSNFFLYCSKASVLSGSLSPSILTVDGATQQSSSTEKKAALLMRVSWVLVLGESRMQGRGFAANRWFVSRGSNVASEGLLHLRARILR